MASSTAGLISPSLDLGEIVELIRLDATRRLDPARRSALGQFFTPAAVARLMASMSVPARGHVRILDPGAGVGVLAAAWVARACSAQERPTSIEITAYEVDPALVPLLRRALESCAEFGHAHGVDVTFEIRTADFIRSAVESLNGGLFGVEWPVFDVAILNPPYKKFRASSVERQLLREVGIETSNLYTAFVALSLRGVKERGELIAITPRSFCNGPYFTPFRKDLLRQSSLTHIHVFDARDVAFGGDDVLQENVIFRLERGRVQAPTVHIEWSDGGDMEHVARRSVPFAQVVRRGDADCFIHITPDEWDARIADVMGGLAASLDTLDVRVSTGRVVEFRAKEQLRADPGADTVPLIYPAHLTGGRVTWPKLGAKKPNALVLSPATADQTNPTGAYVLVKRFSSKEERRRIVAALFEPEMVPGEVVAFENHLNYFHRRGRGLPRELAEGLAAFLNSSLVDSYFRQFNGHTQVNATDLRKLRYPNADELRMIANRTRGRALAQAELDDIVEEILISVRDSTSVTDAASERVAEASSVLDALGLPEEQTNERAALTLLSLLDLGPEQRWSDATNPLRGVLAIMEFAAERYGKRWKPNTREIVRRYTLHQFLDAGIVVANPDQPDRPINSPAFCYQVPDELLAALRTFGTKRWPGRLKAYLRSAETLRARYASERRMQRIPLRVREGVEISLSPGGQNELIRQIVEQFCPRFTPGATPIYIGDAEKKQGYFDDAVLASLGVSVNAHGKMPDVVVHFTDKNWLVLVEAVTSHGPVNAKRRGELKALFEGSSAPLVYVTAFLTRRALNKYLSEIAWETEVWVAEAPTHLIHFNGERFLGPYD